jgi:hypothetical protein
VKWVISEEDVSMRKAGYVAGAVIAVLTLAWCGSAAAQCGGGGGVSMDMKKIMMNMKRHGMAGKRPCFCISFPHASNLLARFIFSGIRRPFTHLATQSAQSRQAAAERLAGISWYDARASSMLS